MVAGHGGHRACRRSRPPKRHGRDPLLPPSSRVPSVVSLVSRRPLTARSGESTATGHGAWPPVLLFRPADPPQADPSRPSRDQRPGIEDTPSRVILHKSPWTFLSLNPQSKTYFPECAISIRKRKLHGLSQKYAFSIYRNAIRTVSLIKLSF